MILFILPFHSSINLHEILKQIMRVVRAGRGLRVILHGKQRQRAMAQAFQRIVIQINVRFQNFGFFQRIRIDSKVVVVRRDLDLAGLQAALPDGCRRGGRT